MFFQFFEDVKIDSESKYFGKLLTCHKGSRICTDILQDALLPYLHVVFLK